VTTAEGPHPFPSRTRPLSPPAPMVLGVIPWESRSLPDFTLTNNSPPFGKKAGCWVLSLPPAFFLDTPDFFFPVDPSLLFNRPSLLPCHPEHSSSTLYHPERSEGSLAPSCQGLRSIPVIPSAARDLWLLTPTPARCFAALSMTKKRAPSVLIHYSAALCSG
jgi:hypothetical protein